MKPTGLARMTGYFVSFGFYAGILVCLSVPFLIRAAAPYYTAFQNHYVPMVIIFMLSGVMGILIFYELKRMFGTIATNDPFVEANVTSLRRMGIYSFSICILMALRLFFDITPTMLVLILVFFIAGLFSLVLAQVFNQAVLYKRENDLTI